MLKENLIVKEKKRQNTFFIFDALAGTGKTTNCLKKINEFTKKELNVLVLYYSNHNLDEFRKINNKCDTHTLHSYAKNLIVDSETINKINKLLIDEKKIQKDILKDKKKAFRLIINSAIKDFDNIKDNIFEDVLVIDEFQDLKGHVFHFAMLLIKYFFKIIGL